MLTVHIRVTDASLGQPTPVRIRVLDAEGRYCAPLGRLTEFATAPGQDVGGNLYLGNEPWAYIDGACEIRLPVGPLQVEVAKGPEYTRVRRDLALRTGQISLRLGIERWTDWRPRGWYAGDVRAHHLSPQAALLEGAAEGLAVVQVLAREIPPSPGVPPSTPGILAVSGTQPAVANPHCVVAVNTLNEHPVLGRVGLLDSHRAVYPLRFGAPDLLDDWSVADWCDQCHRKRGLVTWPDLPRLTDESPQGEVLAALILGKVDAWEVAPGSHPGQLSLENYYLLLNSGVRVPLVGASGKDSNVVPLGKVRTYARLQAGEEFSLPAWVQAVKAGRTFITAGPLLTLEVGAPGAPFGPGGVVEARPGEPVRVRAEVSSGVPFDTLELLAGGRVIASQSSTDDRLRAAVETEVLVQESTWLAARCLGNDMAHTSPVYVEVQGRPLKPDPQAVQPLVRVLDRTGAWVEKEARCATDRQRDHLLGVLASARKALAGEGTSL